MTRRIVATMAASLAAGAAMAQTPPAPPADAQPTCAAEEHRQFDFWLGEWSVTKPDGTPAGHSRIESLLNGCTLLENWTGASGFAGKSFNVYNRNTRRWEQFWVDQSGSRLHLTGGFESGRMRLEGSQDKPDPKTGVRQRERITWTPDGDGSVRQLWETSVDDGKTWTTSFDGIYRRK